MKRYLLLIVLASPFYNQSIVAQTRGFIYEPASVSGAAVLDPNGDGYISNTGQGFMSVTDDVSEFEISMFPLPSIGSGETLSDIRSGPDCGFTDLSVDSNGDAIYSTLDAGNNLIFRFRLSDYRPNAKGYTVFIDTDQLYGSDDPNSTTENPGFEIAVVLRSKSDVFIADIDGATNCSSIVQTYTLSDNHQKAIAGIESCGDADYFYDYFVPFADLTANFGITTSTPLRMVATTNTSNSCALEGSVSDVGGLDDSQYGECVTCAWEDMVDASVPTPPSNLMNGGSGYPAIRTDCPVIDQPIAQGAVTVSGTSENNASIDILVNGVMVDNVMADGSGNWTSNTLTALSPGDIVRAEGTAPGKSVSKSDCNSATVGATCTSVVTDGGLLTASNKGICGNAGSGIAGATINIYLNGVLLNPSGGSDGAGGTGFSGNVVVNPDGSWYWKCNGNNTSCTSGGNCSFANGVYQITQTVSGQCESESIIFCYNVAGTSSTPVVTGPIITTDTDVSGTSAANANIILYADGVQIGTTMANGSGNWTVSSLSLSLCQVITARAIESGSCISNVSTAVSVSEVSTAPTITGTYCSGGTTSVNISGTSTEVENTVIEVFLNAVSQGTTTVNEFGNWSLSSVSVSPGQVITATAEASPACKTTSVASGGVTVGNQSGNAGLSITSPVTEGAVSISGVGINGDLINLYIDTDLLGSTTVSGGSWMIAGFTDEIYAGGALTVTATTGANCESSETTATIVQCTAPLNNQTLALIGGDDEVCEVLEFATFTLVNSEAGIVYQPVDGVGNDLGFSVLGTGGDITLTTFALSSNPTTVNVKAFRITPGVSCESNLTNDITFTVNPLPNASLAVSPNASSVCSGEGLDVQIDNIQTGVEYQLREENGQTLIGTAQTGTAGSSLTLNTGTITTTTDFTVVATNTTTLCSVDLTNTVSATVSGIAPSIILGSVINPMSCGGNDGSIQITNLTANTTYAIDYQDDGVNISANLISNASGNILIENLDAGDYTNLNVTLSGCTSNTITGPVTLSDPANPTITLGTNPSVAEGATSTGLPYTATSNSPNQYTIDYDAAANTAGFTDVISPVTLTTTPLTLVVPAAGPAAIYNGTITVLNSTTGCSSGPVAFTVTINDVTSPTVDIQGEPAAVNSTASYNVTIEFSEDVTGFSLADISVGNGSASNFVAVDGNTYTADITPDGTGDITIDVATAAAQDGAGNDNTAATQAVTLFDNTAPTVDIQGEPALVNSTASYNVTIEFSEDVTGFSLADISVGNGSASNFVAVDGNTYTADITPDGTGDITIDVA
ncbi:hypothetical protein FNH22_26560, partial [Fulvivirga sp. M361]|uniref:beta strand repeat-containing protein n=1 Tax=Fulvivirga sp. M361 TaxID=2594266 RepID=UPI00117B3AE6